MIITFLSTGAKHNNWHTSSILRATTQQKTPTLSGTRLVEVNLQRAQVGIAGRRADLRCCLFGTEPKTSPAAAALAAAVLHSNLVVSVSMKAAVLSSRLFSPHGSRIVTASYDKTARIWDAATAKEIAVLRGHEHFVPFRRLQPEWFGASSRRHMDTRPASGTPRAPRISRRSRPDDPASARRLQPRRFAHRHGVMRQDRPHLDAATAKGDVALRGHDGAARSAAFSPDGSRIVTASSDTPAGIRDAATAKEDRVRPWPCELGSIPPPSNPTGPRIVTASWDDTAPTGDAAYRQGYRGAARPCELGFNSAAFNPDGSRIVTASS